MKRYICILAAILLAIALPSCGVFRPVTDAPVQPSETAASDITDVLTPEASVEDIPIANIPEDVLPPEKKVVSFVGAGDNIVYYGNVRDAASCAVPGVIFFTFFSIPYFLIFGTDSVAHLPPFVKPLAGKTKMSPRFEK